MIPKKIVAKIMRLFLLAFILFLAGCAKKECTSNASCGSGNYCGADYKCYPLEKVTMTKTYTLEGLIMGLSIIGYALYIRYFKSKKCH
ncbi:hypothetical protein HYU06_06885 [Candidatus Woesearchaeota archaeon]|nr:hypothetical protein [Candidatus Woesearchaeota archaeon]